jgi:hypothetical protein
MRVKFVFDNGQELDTIANTFKQACLNIDKPMKAMGLTPHDIAKMFEWDTSRDKVDA